MITPYMSRMVAKEAMSQTEQEFVAQEDMYVTFGTNIAQIRLNSPHS
jgi:hypothetical protein